MDLQRKCITGRGCTVGAWPRPGLLQHRTGIHSRPVSVPKAQPKAQEGVAAESSQTAETDPEMAPRPVDNSPQPRASTSAPAGSSLYEPVFGLPVVRRKVEYGDLLREIRRGAVHEIAYFDSNVATTRQKDEEYNTGVEGYCLVVYKDGSVAQAFVPPWDVRAAYAMETHGVEQTLLNPPPGRGGVLDKEFGFQAVAERIPAFMPVVFLFVVYIGAQIAQWLKGDMEDRQKMRRFDLQRERLAQQQAQADEAAMEARTLAAMGYDVDSICRDLERAKTPYSRGYIERLVSEERERQKGGSGGDQPSEEDPAVTAAMASREAAMLARLREAAESDKSEMEKAKDLLKMKSVKIQRPTTTEDPAQAEMQIRLRKAQRQMKGVRLQYMNEGRVMFDDVAGIGDSKIELTEVVDFFTKPERFTASGAKVPKGILLEGPPGTGKTLLARAVAGEARVSFLSLNASEFVEMFAGLGASRVRDLFNQARSLAPAIIFIDEIDAVGRRRGGSKGNDERDQTLNQLLIEMDGFGGGQTVIVMAATNRVDILDPALVRPGRFDRIITVGLPDFDGRIEILKVHVGYRPHRDDIDYNTLSFETQSFSGAQLANLVNSAAYVAAREDRDVLCMEDFLRALEEERLGPPKKGIYSPERQYRLAVQEAATALACTLMPSIEPVTSVTIVPRDKYPLGKTVVKVNEQRELTNQFTRWYLEEQLVTVLAGRAAEELVYGEDEMSTINQGRLVMARRIATKLIVSGAMTDSPAIGPRALSYPFDSGSRSLSQMVTKRVSAETSYAVDQDMETLLSGAYEQAKALLQRNRAALDEIVRRLTEPDATSRPREASLRDVPFNGNTLDGEEVREIVGRLGDDSDLARRDAEKAAFL